MDEDQSVTNVLGVYNSPAKSDASSLDIYDGLDTNAFLEDVPESKTPPRDCLDLYEEILTEEVTAKEATISNLRVDYEKCQKQMKILIRKFKEIKSQNTSLQNENQCLKKNISALLKTARVEITRKQDEIDHLNQSLHAAPRRHHTHAIPSLLRGVHSIIAQEIKMPRDARLNISNSTARTEFNAHGGPHINIVEKEKVGCSSEVPKAKDLDQVDKTEASSVFSDDTKRGNFSKNTSEKLDTILRSSEVKAAETVVRSEAVVKERSPVGATCYHSNKILSEKEKNSDIEDIGKQSTSKHQNVKLCRERSEMHLPEQMSTDHPEPTDKLSNKEKDTEYRRKDREHKQRKEEWQDISASSQSERETFDLRERLQNSSSIRRKSEGSQKTTHFDMNYESSKKYCTLGSHDKLDTKGRKTLLRGDSGSQNMLKATCETSKHERETGVYRRDRSKDRTKSGEKDNLRKTKVIPDLYPKDERSHNSKGESTNRRNHDDSDRRDKPSSVYSKDLKSLSRTSKELNSSLCHKVETFSSKNDKNERECRSEKKDQEKRGGEKKKYREDRDKYNYERKEHNVQKEGEKLPSQSPTKRKLVNLCRSESLTERTDRTTVDVGKKMLDKELNSPKDLKLSFMQTLNLTLSPAKNVTPREEDTSMESLPACKEKPNAGVSEVSMDPSFVLPKSMGSPGEIKTKQYLDNPADVLRPSLTKRLPDGSSDVVSKVDVPKRHSDNPVHIASKTDVRKPNSDIPVDVVPKTLTDDLVNAVSNMPKPFLIGLVDADSKLDASKPHTDIHVVEDSKTNFTKLLSDTSVAVFSKEVVAEHCSNKPVGGLSKTVQEQLSNNSVDAGSKIDLRIECSDDLGITISKPDAKERQSNSLDDVVSETDVLRPFSDSCLVFSKMSSWDQQFSIDNVISKLTVPKANLDNAAPDVSNMPVTKKQTGSPIVASNTEEIKQLVDRLVNDVSELDISKPDSGSPVNAVLKLPSPKKLSDIPVVVVSKIKVTKPLSMDAFPKEVAAENCSGRSVDGLSETNTQKLHTYSSVDVGSQRGVPKHCSDKSGGTISKTDVKKVHSGSPVDALLKTDAQRQESESTVNARLKTSVHKLRSDSHVVDVTKTDALKRQSDSPADIASKSHARKPHCDKPMDASSNVNCDSLVNVVLKPDVLKLQSDSHLKDVPRTKAPNQSLPSHVDIDAQNNTRKQRLDRPVETLSKIKVPKKRSGGPGDSASKNNVLKKQSDSPIDNNNSTSDTLKRRSDRLVDPTSKTDRSKRHSDSPVDAVSKPDAQKQQPDSHVDIVTKTDAPKHRSKRHVDSESKIVSRRRSDKPGDSESNIVLKEQVDSAVDVSKTDARKQSSSKPVDSKLKDTPKQQSDKPVDSVSKTDSRKQHSGSSQNDEPNQLPASLGAVPKKDTPKHHLGTQGESMCLPGTNEDQHIDFKSARESESIGSQPTDHEDILQSPAVERTDATPTTTMQPTARASEPDNAGYERSQEKESDGSIDLLELGSFIEIDNCSGSSSPLQSNSSKENIVDLCLQDTDLFSNKPEDDCDNANKSKFTIHEKSKGTCQSSNVAHIDLRKEEVPFMPDEGSTMSIDFNVLRHIPKVISPLTSPVKPLGKLHKVQSSATSSVVKVSKKEFSPDASSGKPSVLLRKELNKENCQPEVTSETARGNYSPVLVSSDELEEGEIRSDEEETFKDEKAQAISSPIQHCTAENVKSPPTTAVLKKEVAPSNSPAGRRSSPKKSTIKMKEKSKLKTKKKAASISNMSKNINDISCLDGIVKIVPLSTIEDVLQMLRAIRMRMRSKYMKFKVQVSAQQFYNVIEYGSLRFRILVESLDWSGVCSSPESLKRSICKCVESKFKQIKKNGIVDRIFEQHLTDMKKKLWQFVDDQLDFLFDTLKTMLANLCDKAKPERDGSKSKLTVNATSNTEGPSAAHVKATRHLGSKTACSSNKLFAQELLCSRQRPFEKKSDPNVSSNKQPCFPPNNKAVQKEVVKDVPLQFNSTPLNTGTPKLIQNCLTQSVSPKSDHSFKNVSGLSFDLVSDSHMGDIFKSLLNDADHVQNDDIQEENAWFCISPEKSSFEQKCEIVISPAEATTPVKTSPERLPPSWPLASPSLNRLCSYSTLLHPDILDESCMLEIPSSVSFKSIESLEDRSKSFHSILLEDLAVSLTVPSPLKSDSHLSFLRGSAVSESAHNSAQLMVSQHNEGVHLEEEDATEQDIHLTLDSENSSRCSSPAAAEPPSFHYHPSEPMQAVIMEKSNDHFIVKIRRAVSSNSPASDPSTTECMGSGLSPLEDQDMRAFFEATGRNADTVLRSMEKDETDMLCQVKTCTDGNDLPKDISGKREDVSVTPQLLLNSSTPESKESDLKSPNDSRPETLTPTDIGDSGSPLENSNVRTKALDVVPVNLEPDPLSGRMLPNPTAAENSDTTFVRKRKKSLKAEPEAKRQKVSSSFITENEHMKSVHAENSEAVVLAMDKTHSNHKQSASDVAIKRSTKCHQKNLSAKNVVKKKGEVVVSWTREEDRVILLECQKRGPKEKTFLSLAKSLKKYPYQIEERFKQLMKLFKKSKTTEG